MCIFDYITDLVRAYVSVYTACACMCVCGVCVCVCRAHISTSDHRDRRTRISIQSMGALMCCGAISAVS